MALCSLPRTNPGLQLQYKRVNGPYTLIMTAVGQTGLPYGNLSRLLLAWVCTEAVRTQSRELAPRGSRFRSSCGPTGYGYPSVAATHWRADTAPQPDEAAL